MIVITIIMFGVAVYCSKMSYDAFLSMTNRLERARSAFDRFINKAVTVQGRVLATGYNVEYDFPGMSPDEVLGREVSEDEAEAFEQRRHENRENRKEFGPVMIRYGYTFNNKKIISRVINIYGQKNDLEFFYKLKKGDPVKVLVDPEDPFISSLEMPMEKDHNEVVWNVLTGFAPKVVITLFSWMMFSGVVYSQI